ncbi:hypothetical protein C8R44DRAFT_749829 [Mycena epipterygia]|nr:hypothetical protein C8R44DRAFT_749829 [Mycena epipterygia]
MAESPFKISASPEHLDDPKQKRLRASRDDPVLSHFRNSAPHWSPRSSITDLSSNSVAYGTDSVLLTRSCDVPSILNVLKRATYELVRRPGYSKPGECERSPQKMPSLRGSYWSTPPPQRPLQEPVRMAAARQPRLLPSAVASVEHAYLVMLTVRFVDVFPIALSFFHQPRLGTNVAATSTPSHSKSKSQPT